MSQPRALERVERRQAAAGEQADRAADPAADPLAEQPPAGEQPARARGLERSSRVSGSFGASSTVTSNGAGPRRQVDAAELEIPRHVLEEVDELEAVQTSSDAATSSASSARPSRPRTRRPTGSAEWTQYRFRSSQVAYSAIRWSIRFASISRRNGSRGRANSRIVGWSCCITGHAGAPA